MAGAAQECCAGMQEESPVTVLDSEPTCGGQPGPVLQNHSILELWTCGEGQPQGFSHCLDDPSSTLILASSHSAIPLVSCLLKMPFPPSFSSSSFFLFLRGGVGLAVLSRLALKGFAQENHLPRPAE